MRRTLLHLDAPAGRRRLDETSDDEAMKQPPSAVDVVRSLGRAHALVSDPVTLAAFTRPSSGRTRAPPVLARDCADPAA